MGAFGQLVLRETDARAAGEGLSGEALRRALEAANDRVAAELKRETEDLLNKVLYTTSMHMRNLFAMSDN